MLNFGCDLYYDCAVVRLRWFLAVIWFVAVGCATALVSGSIIFDAVRLCGCAAVRLCGCDDFWLWGCGAVRLWG